MLLQQPKKNPFDFSRLREVYSSETLAEAGDEFSFTMARIVDQWIDSGKSGKHGIVDTPRDRNIEAVPSGYQKPLSGELQGWLTRNPPTPELSRSGSAGFHYPMPDYSELKRSPGLAGHDFAIWWFLNLMDSPLRYRLARCANSACGAYFSYEREPRSSIKNGTFCPACKKVGSMLRTSQIRDAREREMLDAAAYAWGNWKASVKHPDQRDWVAQQVNKRCGSVWRRKWVSQNLTKILKRAGAQPNAKG